MEELQLTPSAPVWEKIELQVRPDKKRRRILFWFLFPAALLAGGIGWLFLQKYEEQGSVTSLPQLSVKKPVRERNSASVKQQDQQGTAARPLQTTPVLGMAGHRLPPGPAAHSRQALAFEKRKGEPISRQMAIHQQPVWNGNLAVAENRTQAATDTFIAESDAGKPVISKTAADTVLHSQQESKDVKPGVGPTVTDTSKKKIAALSKKLARKILFAAGWTQQTGTATSNLYLPPTQSTSSPGPTGATQGPQKTAAGISFSLGYALEKTLSGHLTLTVGLQYAYSSTRQKVGNYKTQDTTLRFQDKEFSVPGYFSNTTTGLAVQTDYTNHFHVAELPVRLHYQPVLRLPLFVTGGVSYGRLISSNALTYDPVAGLLYLNKENNRKSSINLFAATEFTVVDKKGWKFTAGPLIQYNAAPLQKTGNKSHLLFSGLQTGINF